MAGVTLSLSDALLANRIITDADNVPAQITTIGNVLLPAVCMIIETYAPTAPTDVCNAAAVRLFGWMYDADPIEGRNARALHVCGAAAILQGFREHRAVAISPEAAAPGGTPSGAGLPDLPPAGDYILTTQNGELAWVEFPLPE